jgi:hypothetical protein
MLLLSPTYCIFNAVRLIGILNTKARNIPFYEITTCDLLIYTQIRERN